MPRTFQRRRRDPSRWLARQSFLSLRPVDVRCMRRVPVRPSYSLRLLDSDHSPAGCVSVGTKRDTVCAYRKKRMSSAVQYAK